MTIAFNHQYLLDGLNALGSPIAVLSFTDPKKPAVMLPAKDDEEVITGYQYLIMPVRIGS